MEKSEQKSKEGPVRKGPCDDIEGLRGLWTSRRNFKDQLDRLKSKLALPIVAENGNSECPFAEDLYAEKDEKAEEVKRFLDQISCYVPLLEKKIEEKIRHLNILTIDSKNINYEKAVEGYHEAEEMAKVHIEEAKREKRELLDLIERAKQLLKEAEEKKYPGKKPEKHLRFSSFPGAGPSEATPRASPGIQLGGGTPTSLSAPEPSPFGPRLISPGIDSLISLGPLSR